MPHTYVWSNGPDPGPPWRRVVVIEETVRGNMRSSVREGKRGRIYNQTPSIAGIDEAARGDAASSELGQARVANFCGAHIPGIEIESISKPTRLEPRRPKLI
jgi:hypothetical protein